MLGTELRRSPALLSLPLLLLLGWYFLYRLGHDWHGAWPAASIEVQSVAWPFGVVAAVVGALGAGRWNPAGAFDHLLAAPRPRWQVQGAQLVATIAWLTLAYAVVVVAGAVTVLRHPHGPGFLWPGYVALGWVTISTAACLGHLVGHLVPARLAAAVAMGPIMYVLLLAGPASAPVVPVAYSAWQQLSPVTLAARAVALVLLAIAAVTTPPGLLSRHRGPDARATRARGLVAALGALAVTAVAVVGSGPVQVDRPAPSTAACTHGRHRICTWPDNRALLAALQRATDRLDALPTGRLRVRPVFAERGLAGTGAEGEAATLDTTFMGPWGAYQTVAEVILRDSLDTGCPPSDASPELYEALNRADFGLMTYLQTLMNGGPQPGEISGGPSDVDTAAIARLVRRPAAEQDRWVRAQARVLSQEACHRPHHDTNDGAQGGAR